MPSVWATLRRTAQERGKRERLREREAATQERRADAARRALEDAQALQAQLAALPRSLTGTISTTRAIAQVAGIEPDHLFTLLADAYFHGTLQRRGTPNPYVPAQIGAAEAEWDRHCQTTPGLVMTK
jgi:hypothetical protein